MAGVSLRLTHPSILSPHGTCSMTREGQTSASELACGDLEWWRGAAWAFQQAMGLVWYYRETNPGMSALSGGPPWRASSTTQYYRRLPPLAQVPVRVCQPDSGPLRRPDSGPPAVSLVEPFGFEFLMVGVRLMDSKCGRTSHAKI